MLPFSKSQRLLRKIAREPVSDLDSARYLSVTTGRLEPYLRQLSIQSLYFYCTATPDTYFTSDHEEGNFIHAYSTLTRLEAYHRGLLQSQTDMRTTGGFDDCISSDFSQRNIVHFRLVDFLDSYQSQISTASQHMQPGLRIDPLTKNELTIESHHFSTIIALASGRAIPQALSPIGHESLIATPPVEFTQLDKALIYALDTLELHSPVTGTAAKIMRVNIGLKGFGGRSFPTFFIAYDPSNPADKESFATLTSQQILKLVAAGNQPLIIVNPADADWRRELLWDYRFDAVVVGDNMPSAEAAG